MFQWWMSPLKKRSIELIKVRTLEEKNGTKKMKENFSSRIKESKELAKAHLFTFIFRVSIIVIVSCIFGFIVVKKIFKVEPTFIDTTTEIKKFDCAYKNSTERIDCMVAQQKYWEKISIESLKMFEWHPKVAKHITMLQDKAFYSIPVNQTITTFVSKDSAELNRIMRDTTLFEVVYMPEKHEKMRSPVITEPGGKTIRIATSFASKEWLGIILAHELCHVYDMKYDGEDWNDLNQYLMGEVNAHLLEMELVKSLNPKAYAYLLQEGIAYYNKKNFQKLQMLIYSIYIKKHNLSYQEEALIMASCVIAVAFEAEGKDDVENLKKVYTKISSNFGI